MSPKIASEKAAPKARKSFCHFQDIQTRWSDNDQYGHINNTVFYQFFDMIVNNWLIEKKLLHVETGPLIGLVVETRCQFFAPATYPERLDGGLALSHIGKSSVRYEIGIFNHGGGQAIAQGHFIHVYVDPQSMRPQILPTAWRQALTELQPLI